MDVLSVSGFHLSPQKEFDRLVEIRAERWEHLRGRNNVTSCRSPTRELDTRQIKNHLKHKRQQEFLRRRSVSPELCGSVSPRSTSPAKTFPMKQNSSLHSNVQTVTTNRHQANSKGDAPSSSSWVNLRRYYKHNTT